MHTLELVGLGPGKRPSVVAAVLGSGTERGGGVFLAAGPVGVLRLLPDAVLAASLRCRPFTLTIEHGRARFARHLRLPSGLRGLGLGTWLMTSLVRQAVGLGLGASRVRSLHLVPHDASDLRDAFYRTMGFVVTVWRDGSGWARAARLDGLRTEADPAKARLLHRALLRQVPAPDVLLRALAAGPGTR